MHGISPLQRDILIWLLREYQRIEEHGSAHTRQMLTRSGVDWAPGTRWRHYWWGRSLARLEQQGFVCRVDGTPWLRRWTRTTRVVLTDAGRSEAEWLTPLLGPWW